MNPVKSLPTPRTEKQGWPWYEKINEEENVCLDDGKTCPKISIITPSFNQGQFIEETIRSVLLQHYPNLEYIIIDGGSTDESVEIIKKYEPWLSYWISEKDAGQSDAINKGMALATGDIVGWLNSDDIFLEDAIFNMVAEIEQSEDVVAWVGECIFVDRNRKFLMEGNNIIRNDIPLGFCDWENTGLLAQPACFFKRDAFNQVGGLKHYLHYAMDVDLWVQLSKLGPFKQIDHKIAEVRVYQEAKTFDGDPLGEAELVCINIQEGCRNIATKMMYDQLLRRIFLSLDAKQFMLLVSTWLYRSIIKKPLQRLIKRF